MQGTWLEECCKAESSWKQAFACDVKFDHTICGRPYIYVYFALLLWKTVLCCWTLEFVCRLVWEEGVYLQNVGKHPISGCACTSMGAAVYHTCATYTILVLRCLVSLVSFHALYFTCACLGTVCVRRITHFCDLEKKDGGADFIAASPSGPAHVCELSKALSLL